MGATFFLSVLAALMYPFPSLQSLLPPGEGTIGAALLLLRLLSPGVVPGVFLLDSEFFGGLLPFGLQ